MLPRRLALAVLVFLAGLVWQVGPGMPSVQADSMVDQVEGEIICQCGCTYTLEACASAMGCSVGEQMRAEIAAMGKDGMSKAQVLDYYVSKYGEVILAAPTKRGFNLTAWVTPFAAIAAGTVAVYLLLLAWQRGGKPIGVEAQIRRRAVLTPYLEQVDREVKEDVF